MEITKEQVKEYISKNFGVFFVDALAKYVKEVMFKENEDEEEIKEYREELKQLIWSAVAHGTKDYLQEYNGEAVEIIATKFAEAFSRRDFYIKFE